ncbi:uncharacterized protein LOC115704303 [Cannabis sativa]|uniref:uncharacterized protein LOC115704303 n=1 Tax=Cannabis sativa TaxID=3483 RepID=UPI0029C9D4EA|nr:uncharacterized protein LOC115704303 [Cannabis sativa]
MAKKRDRRVASGANRPKDRVEPLTQPDRHGGSASSDRRLIIIIFVFFIVSPAISIFVYRIKYASGTNRKGSSVYQRGLVKPDVNYQEILDENTKVSENTSGRHHTFPVLAYITPWNSRGYESAKRFNSKFTHLSPVWYDLKSQGSDLILEGRHNADIGWISELRMAGDAMVLPRVVLEAFPSDLLRKKKQRSRAINLIVDECKEMGYDGIVLESWSRWAAYGILNDPSMRNSALKFIKQLGDAMHAVNSEQTNKRSLQLIYVIGPPRSETLQEYDFGPRDLKNLDDAVDGFSLMTYDFSGPQNPGPNAPLKWISATMELLLGSTSNGVRHLSHKIFLGINFYGNDFIVSRGEGGGGGGGAITGSDYLSLLKKHRPVLQWEERSEEHLFFYPDDNHINHAVFYPSLLSISVRLEEARKWGCGISIWEIGQGLDYFFDLLEPHKQALRQNYAMEALNAAGLTPISAVLSDRKQEPRKIPSFFKFSNSSSFNTNPSALQECFPKKIHGGLVILSSVLNSGLAKALTYEEALQQTVGDGSSGETGVIDSAISFATENPAILAGGVAILAVPLVLSQLFGKSKPWGVESARNAYAKLGDDPNAQLLDIRPPAESRQVGSPDIRGLGKKSVSIVYKGEDKPGFLKKLSLKFKEPENTTLFVLDKFDGNSELVAELVTVNGFKAAYAIKDGAEGPRGWVNSNLPWIAPKKALSLDFGNFTEAISDAIGGGSGDLSVTIGLAAATGLGLLAFSEIETILQLLGSAAIIQFTSKKLLFAEDRKETLKQVDEFLNTKIAPQELVDEIKQIGQALLPTVSSKALPAPAEASPNAATADSTVQKAEAVPQSKVEEAAPPAPQSKLEAAAQPAQEINSVPKTETKAESLPKVSKPLSPYSCYPDFKPPTSPSPSQP